MLSLQTRPSAQPVEQPVRDRPDAAARVPVEVECGPVHKGSLRQEQAGARADLNPTHRVLNATVRVTGEREQCHGT